LTIEDELLGGNTEIKSACCSFYEHDIIRLLLGDSLHPGGLSLTKELGERLNLKPEDRVLDMASGLGTSAIFLAEEFGSNIIGIDLSTKNVDEANITAQQRGIPNVRFKVGDAEKIPFNADEFDVIISECSFCLFPDKELAAREIYRTLKAKGRLGITDVAIEKALPFDIEKLILKVACIADALSMQGYKEIFEKTGFRITSLLNKKKIVSNTLDDIKKKIFIAELASGLKKVDLSRFDLKEAKLLLNEGRKLFNEGYGTYMLMIGNKH